MNRGSYDAVCDSPLPGAQRLGLRLDGEGRLCELELVPMSVPIKAAPTSLESVLRAFFAGGAIDYPMAPAGTPFQQRVWAAVTRIPRGETRRYGELADSLSSSARAVAGACRANPIPLLIPCHRVVAADGIGGYGGELVGANIELKRWLLEREQAL